MDVHGKAVGEVVVSADDGLEGVGILAAEGLDKEPVGLFVGGRV